MKGSFVGLLSGPVHWGCKVLEINSVQTVKECFWTIINFTTDIVLHDKYGILFN